MDDVAAIAAQERECQAVWRCAIGDSVTALDSLKNKWLASRRKAERQAGEELAKVIELVWAHRNPAPSAYAEANALGDQMNQRVKALLETQHG